MDLRRSGGWLLTQLFPPACPLCYTTFPAAWSAPFCSACLLGFRPLPAAHCSCCALPFPAQENSAHLCGRCIEKPPSFRAVHAVGLYDSSLREAIHHFKFNNRVGLDRPFGIMLDKTLPSDLEVDLLVPVPLHRSRLQQRSYNQSLLLAHEVARCRRLPVAGQLLKKNAETVAQQGLSARERERNLGRAFLVRKKLAGEKILLIDDVMTTGATARACSRALMAAGAAAVDVAVVGRA